jgi:hypothetical protein
MTETLTIRHNRLLRASQKWLRRSGRSGLATDRFDAANYLGLSAAIAAVASFSSTPAIALAIWHVCLPRSIPFYWPVTCRQQRARGPREAPVLLDLADARIRLYSNCCRVATDAARSL